MIMTTPLIPADVAGEVSLSPRGQGMPLAKAGAQDAISFAQLFRARLGMIEVGKSMGMPALPGLVGAPVDTQTASAGYPASALLPAASQLSQPLVDAAEDGGRLDVTEDTLPGQAWPDPAMLQTTPFAAVLPIPSVMHQASPRLSVSRDVGIDAAATPREGMAATAMLADARQILPEGARVDAAPGLGNVLLAPTASPSENTMTAGGAMADALRSASVQPMAMERVVDQARGVLPGRELMAMQLPLRAQGWDGEFAQRVVWMVGRHATLAELTLNPPNLGSVEVRLSLSGNETGAQFFSPQQSVREAIEAALPRLREMLAESGLNLGQAQVSAESFAERRPGEAMRAAAGGAAQSGPDDRPVARAVLGLVDLYV
jgi:flagellar hook-length control protein FliK